MTRLGRTVALTLMIALATPFGAFAAESCPPEPHPCGDEWPAGLNGPFSLAEVRHVQVPSHDGVMLDGWLSFPDLPAGVRAPVILISTPYLATVMVHPGFGPFVFRNPASAVPLQGGTWWDDTEPLDFDQAMNALGVHPIEWIRRGFVLANFSIRGSGHSGGCLDTGGAAEQLDQKVLVDWLATQDWSSGRVGMGGLSYPGWTTWQAAVQAPAGLKAIASLAPIVDYYEYLFTPQGARIVPVTFVVPPLYAQYANPPALGEPSIVAQSMAARAACSNRSDNAAATYSPLVTGTRSKSFFEERDLAPRLGDVRAAVLQVQGFPDPGHFTQDRLLTASLAPGTPIREVRGWWGHEHPDATNPFAPPPDSGESSWKDIVMNWFEYWLKGVGAQPRLSVDHLDQAGTWHESAAWPPPEATLESYFLSDRTLSSSADGEAASFRSILSPDSVFLGGALGVDDRGGATLCEPPAGLPRINAIYTAEPATDTVIAGNPYLEVTISSDLSGGVVSANLYDLGPEFGCGDDGLPIGAKWLAAGGADLEHYDSPYEPQQFPIGTPTTIRIDLTDVTAVMASGHQFAVVIHHGELAERFAQPGRHPAITVYPQSRVVLPVIRGTFEGA